MRLALVLMFLIACGDDDRSVPFRPEPAEETTEPSAPFEARSGHPLEGTSASVGNATLESEGRQLRALLAADFDRDDDEDALAIAVTPQDDQLEVALLYGHREAQQFATRVLGRVLISDCPSPEVRADASQPQPDMLTGSATLGCESGEVTVLLVASGGRAPRLRERFAARGVSLQPRFVDLDEDGHQDLEVVFGSGDDRLTLALLDRPGGMGRDATGLQTSLDALLERAEAGSASALALFDAACGPEPRISVGGRFGLDCPRGQTRRADSMAAVQLARTDLARAVLRMSSASPDAVTRFVAAVPHEEPTWRRVADAPTANALTAILSFTDGTVSIFGATPDPMQPLPEVAPVTSPDGRFIARGIADDAVEIVSAAVGATAGYAVPERTLPLGLPPSGAAWWLLGWAPQGVLVTDGVTRFVAGTGVVPLAADAPAPAPLRGGRVTRDGERWVTETAIGLLVHDGSSVALVRPRGWDEVGGAPRDAAVSEDGRTVAVVKGDGVFVFARDGE